MKKGKDITVADTYLEAYLKPTRTPFPGDCDELIFSSKGAEYLVEYKKCTKKDEKSVVNQSFMRFIENRDRIKYTRINILRNYICGIMGKEIPLINVLFSVEEDDKKIKLENIKNNLQPGKAFTYDVANTPKENKQKFYKYLNRVVD